MRGAVRCLVPVFIQKTKHLNIKAVNYIKRNIKDKEDED